MTATLEQSKLAELRVKTDQELAGLINDQLELGLRLTLIAEGQSSAYDFGKAEPNRAEKTYADALKLLPMVDDPTESRII